MKCNVFCWLLLFPFAVTGQISSFPAMGQLPASAMPICGLDTFRQLTVPYGEGQVISLPGCGEVQVTNPSYYSCTCYSGGLLSLLIAPVTDGQDFNWELFDITGHDPDDIYLIPSLAVIGNWSGLPGRTGARPNGLAYTQCVSPPFNNDSTFSQSPTLIEGHHYLLLVAGYSKNQSHYLLSFAGTTAVITDPEVPRLVSAYLGCNKKNLSVVISKKMRCWSLYADGSEFSLSAAGISITGASGNSCDRQFDMDTVQLTLSDPLPPGSYFISMKNGPDSNTIIDDCGFLLNAGTTLPFTIISTDTVSANFSYETAYGCLADTFKIMNVTNRLYREQWLIDSTVFTFVPGQAIIRPPAESFLIQHIVSGNFCADTLIKIIQPGNYLKAAFQIPGSICPKDLVAFTNLSEGNGATWKWNFGDGNISTDKNPQPHLFPDARSTATYTVTLIAGNNLGCYDTVTAKITESQSCYIAVPNAFTPNGDGKNDYLFPLNIFGATAIGFRVFNRYGQLLFESHSSSGKWDGTVKGALQPAGTYVWTLDYTEGVSGKKNSLRGTSILIR